MHRLRIKKKITQQTKALDPIFSEVEIAVKETKSKPDSAKPEKIQKASAKESQTTSTTVKVKKKILPSLSISINKSINKVSEPTEELKGSEPESANYTVTPLDSESLKKAWHALLAFIPEGQITLRQSLKANEPEIISESEFKFMVSNRFQSEIVQENRGMILNFLQERVKNKALKMLIQVSDKVESNLVFTANDKFKLMLEKNPALEVLRKRLDLELD